MAQSTAAMPPVSANSALISVNDILSTEALKYVAGYVAFKFRFKFPELGVVSSRLDSTRSQASRQQSAARGYRV